MKFFKYALISIIIVLSLGAQEYTFKELSPLLGNSLESFLNVSGAPNIVNCSDNWESGDFSSTWMYWDKIAVSINNETNLINRINFFMKEYEQFIVDGLDYKKITRKDVVNKYGKPSSTSDPEYSYWILSDYILDVWFDDMDKPKEVAIRSTIKYKKTTLKVDDLLALIDKRANNIYKQIGSPGKIVCPKSETQVKDYSAFWDKFSISFLKKLATEIHIYYFDKWDAVKYKGIDFKTAKKNNIISVLGDNYKEYEDLNLLVWDLQDYTFDVYFDILGNPTEFALCVK